MSKKKILVCGASGLIGRNIAEHFATKPDYEVYGTYFTKSPESVKPCYRDNIHMIQADLTDQKEIYNIIDGKDAVIQCAAKVAGIGGTAGKLHTLIPDNVAMGSLTLRAAHDCKVPNFLLFSSNTIYQLQDKPVRDEPVKEADLDLNQQIHERYFGMAWTKIYLEKMCEFYANYGITKHTIIRPANIFGPYDKFDLQKSHVLSATIAKVFNAQDGRLEVWGTGQGERDLLYVSDLVDLVDIALDKQKSGYEVFNAGSGKSVSISNLVKKIVEVSGKDLKIEFKTDKPSMKGKLVLDIAKAEEMLGWHPKISLEEGIRKTIDWYKENYLK